jgi:hypothetical protein
LFGDLRIHRDPEDLSVALRHQARAAILQLLYLELEMDASIVTWKLLGRPCS